MKLIQAAQQYQGASSHFVVDPHATYGQIRSSRQNQESKGIKIQTGTIVDASIIHAPSSTKNEKKERDPAMHSTKKGNQWFFGLKTHIGVDAKQGHVHSVATTAANVSDVHMLPDLLHGEERKVCRPTG